MYTVDESSWQEGWKQETKNIVIGAECRLHNRKIDELVAETQPLLETNEWRRISVFHHLKIFVTGATGTVGGIFARHLALNGNDIYCVVRPGRDGVTPQQRLDDFIYRSKLAEYRDQIHLVEGNYRSMTNFGIEDSQWEWLCQNIDCIFSAGHRTALNMTWKQGAYGVLQPSLTVMKLARSHHIKPIVTVGSCGERMAIANEPGVDFSRGYSLVKFVDKRGFEHLRKRTGHPLRIAVLSYLDEHMYQRPSWYYTYYASWKFGFMMNMYMDSDDAQFQFIDGDEFIMKVLCETDFDPRCEKDAPVNLGGFSRPSQTFTGKEVFEMMSEVQPGLIPVGVSEWTALYDKYLTSLDDEAANVDATHIMEILPEAALRELNDGLYDILPAHPLNVGQTDRETFKELLRGIRDTPPEKFRYHGFGKEYEVRYGQKFWEEDREKRAKL